MEQHQQQPCRFDFSWSEAFHPNFRFGHPELSEARNVSIDPLHQYYGSFRIRNHTWGAALYEIFLDLFENYASKNIVWEEFHLFLMSTYDSKSWKYVPLLLRRASSLGIYRKLRVEMQLLFGQQNPPDTTKEFLLDGIHLNENLQVIELTSIQTRPQGSSEIVGEHQFRMTWGDCATLNRMLETTVCLKELSLNGIGMLQPLVEIGEDGEQEQAWSHPLCEGLAKNTSLEKVEIDFEGCPMTDESLAPLVKSISQIPTLESLTLSLPCQTGQLASTEIQDLLFSSHRLTNLELNGPVSVSSNNLEGYDSEKDNQDSSEGIQLDENRILRGIKSSQSLKSLKLQRVMNSDWCLSRLFEAIRSCPSLRRLEVQGRTAIMKGLEVLVSMQRFDRPLQLILPVDSYLKEYANAMEIIQGFLSKHPEMRLKRPSILSKCTRNNRVHPRVAGGGSERFLDMMEDTLFLSKSFKHLWDFNWHGRYLLNRQDVPLGLWPRVLERATLNPSVMYEFLKSPAMVSWAGATGI